MKKVFSILCILVSFSSFSQNKITIIPAPKNMEEGKGHFTINEKTNIIITEPSWFAIAENLKNQISQSTGWALSIKNKGNRGILFEKVDGMGLEEYQLIIDKNGARISASSPNGAFYGLQTLYQLMPAEIFDQAKTLSVPYVQIEDSPRMNYRGLMLDVGRHFFPVSFIKKYLDLMAFYKLNRFHWHLTEDQGWRIEIKRYPLLTKISSIRKETMVGHYRNQEFDGKAYGGYYTQEEIKEVVAYAADRYITVVPEIEMPGHSQAVLAAYPQLGSNQDKIYEVATKWGVSKDVYAPREATFEFLQNVLTEVMELFPGEYIHIGGDECPKDQWKESRFAQNLIKKEGLKDEHELQSYFIQRIDQFVSSKGRKIIGWDEILEGGLSKNATVMSWRGTEGGIEAAKQRHDVIMSPNSYYYLDYYQAESKTQPLAIGGFLPLEKSYSFEPELDELSEEEAKHVIGVQANVWTEYISSGAYAEYMTFPRALALSEVGWTVKEKKNYEDFKKRLNEHRKHLDAMGINYCKVEFE